MKTLTTVALVVALCSGLSGVTWAAPMGTVFTYQGQLKDGGLPVTDTCDLKFRLFDDATTPPGAQVGPTLTFDGQGGNPDPIEVENGLFTVTLDFGADIFTGEKRWLEIEVALPSGGAYVLLEPRQELTPAPYATYAAKAGSPDGHSLDAADGSPTDALYVDNAGNVGIGTTSPNAMLEVRGDNQAVRARAANDGPGETPRYIQMRYHDSIGPLLDGLGYPRLTLDADFGAAGKIVLGRDGDKVGIGLIDPEDPLHVVGDMRLVGDIKDAYGVPRIQIPHFYSTYINDTNGVQRICILPEGNVGVWTTGPHNALDVKGAVAVGDDGFRTTAPDHGMIVQGDVGIGTNDPKGALHVSGGSIAHRSVGVLGQGKISVLTQEGTLDNNGDFLVSLTSSLCKSWHYDNYIFKVEVFVSIDMFQSGSPTNRGSGYSRALIGKQRGSGPFVHFDEEYTKWFDTEITFAYSSSAAEQLDITVSTNRPNDTPYRVTVKTSH